MDQLKEIKQAIYKKRPKLKRIIDNNKSLSVLDYVQDIIVNSNKVLEARQEEILEVIRQVVKESLGDSVALSVKEQLKKYYTVSTADHHGPLMHPFFISSNLIQGCIKKDGYENVVVLACGSISLNNSSYPRGLIAHIPTNSGISTEHFPLFPWSLRQSPVLTLKAYSHQQVDSMLRSLSDKLKRSSLPNELQQVFLEKVQRIYASDQVLSRKYFSEQVTITNFKLWKEFPSYNDDKIPNLIYLELEEIVSRLLLKYHLFQDTEISKLFFDSRIQESLMEFANKIPGAFSLEDTAGSFLFWGVDKKNKKRVSLWKAGDQLESLDKSFFIKLEQEGLAKALSEKSIIPTSLLCFFVLCSYYKLKCLGGFSQTTYLPQMLDAYSKIFQQTSIDTQNKSLAEGFCSDMLLAYGSNAKNEILPLYGLDILAYSKKEFWPSFEKTAERLHLEEAVMPLLPDLYKILYSERSDLKIEQIVRNQLLVNKIVPCLQI